MIKRIIIEARDFYSTQNEPAKCTSTWIWRVSSAGSFRSDVQQSEREKFARQFLHDGYVSIALNSRVWIQFINLFDNGYRNVTSTVLVRQWFRIFAAGSRATEESADSEYTPSMLGKNVSDEISIERIVCFSAGSKGQWSDRIAKGNRGSRPTPRASHSRKQTDSPASRNR